MSIFWPYISFILGAVFALALQWISYYLAFKKDKRKEYWIRKLNSYQDFYQHATQLIDLMELETQIPTDVFWQSISAARKAAYDAKFYDLSNVEQANKMIEITRKLIRLRGHPPPDGMEPLRHEIDDVQSNFYSEEKLLGKENLKS